MAEMEYKHIISKHGDVWRFERVIVNRFGICTVMEVICASRKKSDCIDYANANGINPIIEQEPRGCKW